MLFFYVCPQFRVYIVIEKKVSRNFEHPKKVDLAVLKKIFIFSRFQNSSINLFGITSEESWFLIS